MQAIKTISLSILLTILATGCAVNPVTGKNELSWISDQDQIQIGEQQYSPSQQSQGGQYLASPEINDYVNEVGQRVAAFSPAKLPYEFVVLNNSTPNAWALPGGKIAVNRGLLLELNSEAELAAVLGHEVVHAAAKHGAQSMQRGQITQGLLAATAFGISQSDYKQYSKYVVGGAQIGAKLIGTKYGREAELESDFYGIEYMNKAGYSPKAAISLQETFVRLSEGRQTSWLEGLFASHPPSPERVRANKASVNALGNPDGNLFANRYQQKMAHITKTKAAYDKLGQAQALASSGDYAPALRALDQAAKIEPNEARFHGLKGKIYYEQKKYSEATNAFNRALDLDDSYFEYYLGRGLAHNKQGNSAQAKMDLEQSNKLLPTAVASQSLGEMSLTAGNRNVAKQYFQLAMSAQGVVGKQAGTAFSRLDVQDNPQKYVTAQLKPNADGRLMLVVLNRSEVNLINITLNVGIALDQVTKRQQFVVSSLPARQQGAVKTPWQITEQSLVQNVQIAIQGLQVK